MDNVNVDLDSIIRAKERIVNKQKCIIILLSIMVFILLLVVIYESVEMKNMYNERHFHKITVDKNLQ